MRKTRRAGSRRNRAGRKARSARLATVRSAVYFCQRASVGRFAMGLGRVEGRKNFPYNTCFRESSLSRRQMTPAFQVCNGVCAKHRSRESRSPWTRARGNPGSRPQALDRIFWASGLHPLRARPQHAARTAAVCASKLGPPRHAEAQRLPWRPLYEDLAQIVAMVRSRTRAAAGPALVCRASRRLNCPTDRQIIPYTHECWVFYEKVRAI